jgi:hypothetical protein
VRKLARAALGTRARLRALEELIVRSAGDAHTVRKVLPGNGALC